jgi:hypothetical protein
MTFLVRGTKRVLGVVSDHGWKKTAAGSETLKLYDLTSAAVLATFSLPPRTK